VDGEADWDNASNDNEWSKPGGDYSSRAAAKVTIPRSEGKRWIPYNIQETIQKFVEDPESNFGFIIVNTRMSQEIDLISSDNSDTEHRPKLTVTYEAETTPVTVHQNQRNPVHGLNVQTGRSLLRLDGSGISSATMVKVFRPDGKCILYTTVLPGGHKELSGVGSGVYLVTTARSGGQHISVIVP
jgi:hypothetical protein